MPKSGDVSTRIDLPDKTYIYETVSDNSNGDVSTYQCHDSSHGNVGAQLGLTGLALASINDKQAAEHEAAKDYEALEAVPLSESEQMAREAAVQLDKVGIPPRRRHACSYAPSDERVWGGEHGCGARGPVQGHGRSCCLVRIAKPMARLLQHESHRRTVPEQLQDEARSPRGLAQAVHLVEGRRRRRGLPASAQVHHPPQMVRLCSVPGLPYPGLDLVGALVADLGVALLEAPAVAIVVALEQRIVGVRGVVGKVLCQRLGEQVLVLEARRAKGAVRRDGGLGRCVSRRRGFALRGDWRVRDVAILPTVSTGYRACKMARRVLTSSK